MNSNKWIFAIIGLLVAAIIVVGIYVAVLIFTQPTNEVAFISLDDARIDGITPVEPPIIIPNFTLQNQADIPTQLTDFSGKYTLLTFGFTHCPDVCPLTLSEMRQIRTALGDNGDALNYVLISVDGERDTPAVLNTYLIALQVQPFMTALTGSNEAIQAVTDSFGAVFGFGEVQPDGSYAVEHTAGMFLLDQNGQWIRRYSYGTLRSSIINDIQAILASS